MENYDPRMDFYKRGLDFLFKQTPAIAICMAAVFVMWQKSESVQAQGKEEAARIQSEYSTALNETRMELRMCEENRQGLEVQFAKLSVRFERLEKRGK